MVYLKEVQFFTVSLKVQKNNTLEDLSSFTLFLFFSIVQSVLSI